MPDFLWLPLVIIAAFALAGILGAVFLRFLPSSTSRASDLPYRKRDYLLSRAERSFYGVLRRSTPPDLVVFPKVRLADILYIPRGSETRQSHQNRINFKHVDFLLCSVSTISPILVVELDDSSHQSDDRAARDAFVDAALAAAGLPILHVRAREAYNPRDLSAQIAAALARVPALSLH